MTAAASILDVVNPSSQPAQTSLSLSDVAIDAEWDSLLNVNICVQYVSNSGEQAIVFNRDIESYDPERFPEIVRRLQKKCDSDGITLIWSDFGDDADLTSQVLEAFEIRKKTVELLAFYSFKDFYLALGWNNLKTELGTKKLEGAITQKRCIQAKNIKVGSRSYDFRDLKGWAGIGGLKNLAESVGVSMVDKGKLDHCKGNMLLGLYEDPETFVDYAMGDTTVLHVVYRKFSEMVRKVGREQLGVELPETLPQTTGALVALLLRTWIEKQTAHPAAFRMACMKLGQLDTDSRMHQKYRRQLAILVKTVKTIEDAERHSTAIDELYDAYGAWKTLAFSEASVAVVARLESSAAFGALVQGGRCNNENPWNQRLGKGLDIDLQSCYGSALRTLSYPVGLPTIIGNAPNERGLTLAEALKRDECDIVEGLAQYVVSGRLSFDQDLLFSKICELSEIHKAVHIGFDKELTEDDGRNDDLSHLPGDFALLRRELVNAVITPDILKALKAACTNREWNEIANLEVVSSTVYRQSDRCKTMDNWISAVLADKGTLKGDGVSGRLRDTRTRKWLALPLENFIGKLVVERGRLKALKGSLEKSDPKRDECDSLQTALKLIINTTYGVLASPFFIVGNTVVANNITARARLGTWMLNKALRTVQSITDGGMYVPSEVAFLEPNASKGKSYNKLPGLAVLSDRRGWLKRGTCRKLGSLGGIDWNERIRSGMTFAETQALGKEADAIALDHVNAFWSPYGLELPFAIEHKGENTFLAAAYTSKAHYAVDTVLGDRKYKLRGARKDQTADDGSALRDHPLYEYLDAILDGSDDFPVELDYDHSTLLKIAAWRVSHSTDENGARPGDRIVQHRIAHWNNRHFPVSTVAEYRSRSSRRTHRTENGEHVNIELFERHRVEGIAAVNNRMAEDKLR